MHAELKFLHESPDFAPFLFLNSLCSQCRIELRFHTILYRGARNNFIHSRDGNFSSLLQIAFKLCKALRFAFWPQSSNSSRLICPGRSACTYTYLCHCCWVDNQLGSRLLRRGPLRFSFTSSQDKTTIMASSHPSRRSATDAHFSTAILIGKFTPD